MRKVLLSLVGAVFVLGVVAFFALRMPWVQDQVFQWAVESRVGLVWEGAGDPDQLQLVFCGTGSPMPDPGRGQACVGVFAGDHFFLIDSGAGAAATLAGLRIPMGGLDGILYTHFHSDHISGLPDIVLQSWVAGRHQPLDLYGPEGIERVTAGFSEAYVLDGIYRTAHHGAEAMPPSGSKLVGHTVPVATDLASAVVFDADGLKITAFRVGHAPIDPAYGYRIDYKGRSVVFSGDTVKHANMVRFGAGVDVMVHEALARHMVSTLSEALLAGAPGRPLGLGKILADTLDYHTSPVEAAEVANEAGASLLVYSHIVPPLPNALVADIFLRGVDDIRPEGVVLGYDGMLVRLPVGSASILVEDLR